MNIERGTSADLRNRDATPQMRRYDRLWDAIDEVADRVGANKTAYQFALRMLLLRAVADPLETVDVWLQFRREAQESSGTEGSIARVLEFALEREIANSAAESTIWEIRDHIQRPSAETQDALQELVSAVDYCDGDPVVAFGLVLERYSRTNGEGGDYFTPRSVVSLAVRLADPKPGETIFDPACGSGGFLVAAHMHAAISQNAAPQLFGRESNRDAWQIAQMNLLAYGLRADLGEKPIDSLLCHEERRAAGNDVVLLNPPFNQKDWATDLEIKDLLWKFGDPPRSNANFAWLQRALALLAPHGRACVLMPAKSARDSRSKAREITRRFVGSDVIEALVMLPPSLFPHVRVSACVWVLNKDKRAVVSSALRDRHDEILLIDASEMGEQVTRGQCVVPDPAIERITTLLHSWRSHNWTSLRPELESVGPSGPWWTTVTKMDVESQEWDLTPSRYIGGSHPDDGRQSSNLDAEFDDLVRRLADRMARVRHLDRVLLEKLGDW